MSIEAVEDNNILYLGTDLLVERVRETREMIEGLRTEESDLIQRLSRVRSTRRFLQREYVKLTDMILEANNIP